MWGYTRYISPRLGCKVYVSASEKNEEFLKGLGVNEVRMYHRPKGLITLTGEQFYDYTKRPIHQTLIQNPPSPKFDVIFETVRHAYVPLFTYSEAYLAPNGVYISVGPTPGGVGGALSSIWNVFMHPKWAGGTKRRFEYVHSPPWPSSYRPECELVVQQTTQNTENCEVDG